MNRTNLIEVIAGAAETIADTVGQHLSTLPPDHLFALESAYYDLTGNPLFSEAQRQQLLARANRPPAAGVGRF
jgi:hypothetical protein